MASDVVATTSRVSVPLPEFGVNMKQRGAKGEERLKSRLVITPSEEPRRKRKTRDARTGGMRVQPRSLRKAPTGQMQTGQEWASNPESRAKKGYHVIGRCAREIADQGFCNSWDAPKSDALPVTDRPSFDSRHAVRRISEADSDAVVRVRGGARLEGGAGSYRPGHTGLQIRNVMHITSRGAMASLFAIAASIVLSAAFPL